MRKCERPGFDGDVCRDYCRGCFVFEHLMRTKPEFLPGVVYTLYDVDGCKSEAKCIRYLVENGVDIERALYGNAFGFEQVPTPRSNGAKK